jgi:hypothetical protein
LTTAESPAIFKQSLEEGRNRRWLVARTVDCPCGVVLSGADDDELFRLGREHVDEHHPDENISNEFIREHIASSARNAA